uniref:Juvenile hormone acid O-methyltransferase n=1 Tax=Glossina brevipalpis TaxID=37001 RepID=A0A1A9WKH6_9MUSC
MNRAGLYQRANAVQRHDAEQILKEYSYLLQWQLNGQDNLIDIGSGSGDVLKDFIYPLMPRNFGRLVGSDISSKMCKYARKTYKLDERCDFRILDIATEKELPIDLQGQFDHVTSFYCLHWVQNQRQALRNVYDLLRSEGGDCLLVFLVDNPIYDVYLSLSKSSKWSSYMADVERFICPFHRIEKPQNKFAAMLREEGFNHIKTELHHKTYDYKGVDILKDNIEAVCPFLERIPRHQHSEFWEDFFNIIIDLDLQHITQQQITVTYKLMVAYARKTPKFLNNDS